MSSIYLPTTALDSSFPLAEGTMYNYKSTGRIDWLIRRGRILWINVERFNRWAALEGKKFRLSADHSMAVDFEIEEGELAH